MRPSLPAPLASRGYASGGIAPALLLDVQTPSGDMHYWADRALANIPSGFAIPGTLAPAVTYLPWLLGSGSFSFNRSLVTDTMTLTMQNISGDVLQTDFERIVRKSTLEGSIFVFRYYAVDLAWAWITMQGTLSVGETRGTLTLNGSQLLQGQDDTPVQQVSESCQLIWAQPRCGATGSTECNYTYASCQVTERFVGISTSFETANPESVANVPVTPVNRKRAW